MIALIFFSLAELVILLMLVAHQHYLLAFLAWIFLPFVWVLLICVATPSRKISNGRAVARPYDL
jgi:hypothetical protein